MHDEYLIVLVMQSANVDREKALDLIYMVKTIIKYPKHNSKYKTPPTWQLANQQLKAEHLLLQQANELKDGLCIGFNRSMTLAREINYTLTYVSQRK
jgi:hypothetical protein